jgi:hypothetical protein
MMFRRFLRPVARALRVTSVLVFAFVLLVLALPEGRAMGVFSRLVLFSEVHGAVLNEGKPVAGAEIVRRVAWSGDEVENRTQQTVAGKDGAFMFRRSPCAQNVPSQLDQHTSKR